MHHQKRQVQGGGKLDFLHQRADRQVPIFRGRRSKVDEITCVAEYGLNPRLGERRVIKRYVSSRRRLAKPLHVVFDEDLADIAANLTRPLKSGMNPASGRTVRAEKHWEYRMARTRAPAKAPPAEQATERSWPGGGRRRRRPRHGGRSSK